MAALTYLNLGSGSAGNASAIVMEDGGPIRVLLVDLGLSPSRCREMLASASLRPEQVVGVLLTHLDHDHYRPTWARSLVHRGIPVHVHEQHAEAALAAGVPSACLRAYEGELRPTEGLRVSTLLASHDERGSVAMRLDAEGVSIGLATDLGRVPEALIELFAGVDLLGLESNYCPRMQAASPRPAFLKRRITGGHGHLSNAEAIAAATAISARSDLRHLVLLHLSRECNDRELVARLFEEALPWLRGRTSIARQDEMTGPLRIEAAAIGAAR